MLSAEGSRHLGNPSDSTSPACETAVERVASIRLEREHSKRVVLLGLAGGICALVTMGILLAIADSMGRIAGAAFVFATGAVAAAGFLALFVPRCAEPFVARAPAPNDPLTGRPMRMLWWWRWFSGALAFLMFLGLSDYIGKVPADTGTSSPGAQSDAQPIDGGSANGASGDAPARTASESTATNSSLPPDSSVIGVAEYLAKFNQETNDLTRSVDEFTSLSSQLAVNPEIFWESWQSQMAAQFVTWQATYEHASSGAAPPDYARFNEKWVLTLEILASAGKDYEHAIDDRNPAEVESADEEIESSVHELKSAQADMPVAP